MKKLVVLLLLPCLLCSCGLDKENHAEPSKPVPVLTDTEPVESEETMNAEEGLIRETAPETEPESPAPGQHQAAYAISEWDDSIRNENGDTLVTIRYQQVLLNAAQPQWENINDLLRADYRAFSEEVAYLRETGPEEWEEFLQSMGALHGNLLATRSARVTNNSGSIFSICMTRDWYMGGVFNSDHYGLNFDLTTGEALPLSRLSELPEAEFEALLKNIICEKLAENGDFLLEDPAVILENYALSDLDFYVEEGELVLTFPTYTFGPGVMGATIIHTGLFPQL